MNQRNSTSTTLATINKKSADLLPWVTEQDIAPLRKAAKALGSVKDEETTRQFNDILDKLIAGANTTDNAQELAVRVFMTFRGGLGTVMHSAKLDNPALREKVMGEIPDLYPTIETIRKKLDNVLAQTVRTPTHTRTNTTSTSTASSIPTATAKSSSWLPDFQVLNIAGVVDNNKIILEGSSGYHSKHHAIFNNLFTLLTRLKDLDTLDENVYIEQFGNMYLNPKVIEIADVLKKMSALWFNDVFQAASASNKLNNQTDRAKFFKNYEDFFSFYQGATTAYGRLLNDAKKRLIAEGVEESSFVPQAAPIANQNTYTPMMHMIVEEKNSQSEFENARLRAPSVSMTMMAVPQAKVDNDASPLLLKNQLLRLTKLLNDAKKNKSNAVKNAFDNLLINLESVGEKSKSPQDLSKAVHFEVMQTYLITGYLNERKKTLGMVRKGDVSNALEDVLKQFNDDYRDETSFFKGKGRTKGNVLESQIMTSIRNPKEAQLLTQLAFERAMIDGVLNNDARYFINAVKMVIGIEDQNMISTKFWNALVDKHADMQSLNPEQIKALKISEDLKDPSRKEDNIVKAFEKHIEKNTQTLNAVLPQFYPSIMVQLINQNNEEEKFSPQEQASIDSFVNDLKVIQGNNKQCASKFYETVLDFYVNSYVSERNRDHLHRTEKGPVLSFVENVIKEFQNKTKTEIFNGQGKEPHDKILRSAETFKVDSNTQQTALEHIVEQMFTRLMHALTLPTSNVETQFANTYKVLDRMGSQAREEWNRVIQGVFKPFASNATSSATKTLSELGKLLLIPKNAEISENQSRDLYKKSFLNNSDVSQIASNYMHSVRRGDGPIIRMSLRDAESLHAKKTQNSFLTRPSVNTQTISIGTSANSASPTASPNPATTPNTAESADNDTPPPLLSSVKKSR